LRVLGKGVVDVETGSISGIVELTMVGAVELEVELNRRL